MSAYIVAHFKDGKWQEIARYYGPIGLREAIGVVRRNRELYNAYFFLFTQNEWDSQQAHLTDPEGSYAR